MANWEKKSAHLLREIVKFRTYMDSLGAAAAARERVYRDRDELLPAAAASAPDPQERAADADGPQDPAEDACRREGAEVEPQGRGAQPEER